MNLKKTAITLALAAMTLGVTAASAYAASAFATGSVNVRSGPGTGYRVVDQLRRGEQVDVLGCRGSWCHVSKPGPDGWVSANYLATGGRYYDEDDYYDDYRPRQRRPRVHFNDYYDYPDASFCVGGQNASFCLNGY